MARSKRKKWFLENTDMALLCVDQCLNLFYKNNEITNDLGLYSSFLINGSWVDSHRGIWQIQIKNDVLYITVDWQQYPLRQLWQIRKIKQGFNWTVYTDIKEEILIQKMQSGMMLNEQYERWFNGIEEGNFPDFCDSWCDIFLQDINSKVCGVSGHGYLPDIICQNLRDGQVLIQNMPQNLSRSRLLHIEINTNSEVQKPNRYKHFSMDFFISKDKEKSIKLKDDKIKQSLMSKYIEEGKLKVVLDNFKIKVYWQDLELTANHGLHSALFVNNEWYDSSKCKINIEKINQNCFYLKLNWQPLPVEQIWQITIKDENSFMWQVKTLVNENNLDIKTQTLGLILNAEYKEWFGAYEQGVFPEEFKDWLPVIKDGSNAGVGVKKSGHYPAVMFKNNCAAHSELIVQNGDSNYQSRFIQAIKNTKSEQPEKEDSNYDFSQEITLIEDSEQIVKHLEKKMDEIIMQRGIEQGNLRLLVDGQKLRIFWKNKELTTNIGMHTAISSNHQWYYSGYLKVDWQVNKISNDHFKITLNFEPFFPASQIWDLKLAGGKAINWNIMMQLKKTVSIEERKTGLILRPEYKRWFNSFEQGLFPEAFTIWHDVIRNRDGDVFGVFPEDGRPAVMFTVDGNHLSLIQNSDKNVNGRALQAQILEIDETKQYQAREFEFFKGKIEIIESEKEIDRFVDESKPLVLKEEAIYIYGDSEELSDRIAGVCEFADKIEKIKNLRGQNKGIKIKIGVSRYNFFKLNEIVQFVLELLDIRIDLRSLKLSAMPLKKLRRNFIEYLTELRLVLAKTQDIELVLADSLLFELITSIYTQVGIENERQLLRLLGVICEHAFIGPQIVVIDPYHQCNANCVHCWVHTPKVTHAKGFYDEKLEFEQFKKICDDLSDLMVDKIIFQGDGEPLLHRDFFKMLEYARKKGIQCAFFTNGILLDKDIAQRVVNLGINEIFCSLPAGTAKAYGQINAKQKKEVFAKILDNLKYLTSFRKKMSKISPRLVMTHVIHTENAHELLEMAKNDVDIDADVARFYLIRLDDNIQFLKLKKKDIETIKATLPKIKEYIKGKRIQLLDTTEFQLAHFEQESGAWSKDIFKNQGCTLGWNFSLIPASGAISFCCHLRTVGYLKEKSFKEIWSSDEYRRFRYQAKFLNKYKDAKFINGTPLFDEYCEHCDTHQVIRDVWGQFELYGLKKYLL
ncbi:MAG: radical SAM protein [Candidatus Omnitrophica bacterium]|nr:radical SAM protein [Candidatus Omnitrophota bacterium]